MTFNVPPIRAVLFDLDDTLNDRSRSWKRFVERLTDPHLELLGPFDHGAAYRLIVENDEGGRRDKGELFAALSVGLPWKRPIDAPALESFWRLHFPSCMVTRDHARELLNDLRVRNIRTAIVTNGRHDQQTAKLSAMGLSGAVDLVVTSGSFGAKKPAAAIYRHALDHLCVSAAEAIFVGDNPEADICGPGQIGLRTVWLRNGRTWPADLDSPTDSIDGLDEIWPILDRVTPS